MIQRRSTTFSGPHKRNTKRATLLQLCKMMIIALTTCGVFIMHRREGREDKFGVLEKEILIQTLGCFTPTKNEGLSTLLDCIHLEKLEFWQLKPWLKPKIQVRSALRTVRAQRDTQLCYIRENITESINWLDCRANKNSVLDGSKVTAKKKTRHWTSAKVCTCAKSARPLNK